MKLLTISFEECLTTGAFGPIRVGASRYLFDDLLGEPTQAAFVNRKRTAVVWKFGSIEFHIDNDVLVLIRSDGDHLFNGGPNLHVTSHKLHYGMRQSEVERVLVGRKIEYNALRHADWPETQIQIKSGVTLGFVADGSAAIEAASLCSWSIGPSG